MGEAPTGTDSWALDNGCRVHFRVDIYAGCVDAARVVDLLGFEFFWISNFGSFFFCPSDFGLGIL
jgi:hypothetical protein